MAIYSKFLELQSGAARTVDLSTNTLSVQGLQINAATGGGALTQAAHSTTTSYSIVWPAAQAASSGYVLTNDGAGNLSWAPAASSGANTALSNLASVAINTSLLPGADNSINLGSASFSWATANIHALNDASGTAIDVYNRALNDSSAATQLSWSTSGVEFNQLTASTVPYLSAGKILTSSAVTPTQLGFLSGVTGTTGTGNLVLSASPTFTGTVSAAAASLSGALNMNSNQINNVSDPTSAQDAATKNYVDNFINGLSWKNSVLVATTANITLSGEQTIDGFTTSASRVLVKNQTTASQNGIYVSAAGAWSRAVDMSTWAEVPASAVFVQEGTVNADIGFVCTSQPGGTLGTTAITFVQFSSVGAYTADGVTLQLISGQFSIKNGGVTETQINSSSFSTTGAITGGSGTKISANVDNSTIDINGSNQLEVKSGGITNTQVSASAAIAFSKLAALTSANILVGNGSNVATSVAVSGDLTLANTGAFTVAKIQGTSVSGTTGSGNVVFSASPTFTGTITAAAANFSGAISASNFSGSSSGTNTGDQTITLTGDVTGSGTGSFATTIANNAVTTVKINNGAVTAAKLGSVTDGITTDQNGSGSTIEVLNAPALKRTLVAGQSFSANTSYAVRWGLTSNSETANRVYAADITTSSFDLFYVIGMASSGTSVSAGQNIVVTTLGSFSLSSSDTAFASSTDGLAVFLTASGTFSTTAPSTSGQAVTRIGIIQQRSATVTSNIIDVAPHFVGVN